MIRGMRMMQEQWQALGHPAPVVKNDRSWKAFEFFIPELDKEVDMASDLMKAMFAERQLGGAKSEHQEGQVAGQVAGQVNEEIIRLLSVLKGDLSRKALQDAAGLKGRDNFEKRYLKPALEAELIAMTLPDKPNSRLQKYRLTDKGRVILKKTSKD